MIAPADRLPRLRRAPIPAPCLDQAQPADLRVGSLWTDSHAFNAFAEEVDRAIDVDGRALRYSQRLRLIGVAEYFGIRRFDANLIIALVQNRHQRRPPPEENPQSKSSLLTTIAMFAAVQILILAAGWWILF